MWIIFMLAALLMLVGGVGGTIVIEKELLTVPPQITENLAFIKDLMMTGGIFLCLFGLALIHRKMRNVGRRRGGSGRSGRTRAIEFPKKSRGKAVVDDEQNAIPDDAIPDDALASEQPTLLFAGNRDEEDEPGTKKMRKIGRR